MNSRSSFVIDPIDRIQMAVTSFSKSVDTIQIARPIIIADEVIFISQLWTKNIIKGIWSSSPLSAGIWFIFDAVGEDFASVSRCFCKWIPDEWRRLHGLLKQGKGVWLQETLIDIQFTIRCNEGNDVLSWMPCHVDYAWVIVSAPMLARGLLAGCLDHDHLARIFCVLVSHNRIFLSDAEVMSRAPFGDQTSAVTSPM